jgi:archaellum biogenesis ATPase FlaH
MRESSPWRISCTFNEQVLAEAVLRILRSSKGAYVRRLEKVSFGVKDIRVVPVMQITLIGSPI